MIVVDTDLLSSMAKIGKVSLLYSLFEINELSITPAVFAELEYSSSEGRQYAIDILGLLNSEKIRIVHPAPEEIAFRDSLPSSLALGERESIAVARKMSATLLSNESWVAHYCRQWDVSCLRLSDILRAFWTGGLATKEQVQQMVTELEREDQMQFRQTTLEQIFADDTEQ